MDRETRRQRLEVATGKPVPEGVLDFFGALDDIARPSFRDRILAPFRRLYRRYRHWRHPIKTSAAFQKGDFITTRNADGEEVLHEVVSATATELTVKDGTTITFSA